MTIEPLIEPARNVGDRPPSWIELVRPAADLAVQIAATEFVPAEFRNRPEVIAAAILFGAELGIGPMVALAKIAVVKGRPAPSAELGRALALAAGHEVWIEEASNTRVVMCGKRRGSSHVFKVAWSMDDARRAGIAANPSYAKYPRQMLVARASAELVRQMAPDVLGGITVFAEEAVDIDGDTVALAPVAPVASPSTRRRQRAQTPRLAAVRSVAPEDASEHADDGDDGAGDVDDRGDEPAPPDQPSEAQKKFVMARLKNQGIDDRATRLAATGALIGRTITSWNDVTRDEASTVIDGLERLDAGTITFNIDADGTWRTVAVIDDDLDG